MLEKPTKPNHIYLICMYKQNLALNNLQWFIRHKTKPDQNQISGLNIPKRVDIPLKKKKLNLYI